MYISTLKRASRGLWALLLLCITEVIHAQTQGAATLNNFAFEMPTTENMVVAGLIMLGVTMIVAGALWMVLAFLIRSILEKKLSYKKPLFLMAGGIVFLFAAKYAVGYVL